jgi:hypothetical protein
MPIRSLQSEFITIRSETEQATVCDVTEIAVLPKLLSRERIAQVDFDKRDLNGQKSISQCDAGMREATGVQDDKFDAIDVGLLDSIDELMLGIALKTNQLVSKVRRKLNTTFFDIGEAGGPIDLGLACAKQVQIGTVNEQKSGHFEGFAAR